MTTKAIYTKKLTDPASASVAAHALLFGESTRGRSWSGIREMTRTVEEVPSR